MPIKASNKGTPKQGFAPVCIYWKQGWFFVYISKRKCRFCTYFSVAPSVCRRIYKRECVLSRHSGTNPFLPCGRPRYFGCVEHTRSACWNRHLHTTVFCCACTRKWRVPRHRGRTVQRCRRTLQSEAMSASHACGRFTAPALQCTRQSVRRGAVRRIYAERNSREKRHYSPRAWRFHVTACGKRGRTYRLRHNCEKYVSEIKQQNGNFILKLPFSLHRITVNYKNPLAQYNAKRIFRFIKNRSQ